jgi:hypothetical protein
MRHDEIAAAGARDAAAALAPRMDHPNRDRALVPPCASCGDSARHTALVRPPRREAGGHAFDERRIARTGLEQLERRLC